MTGFLRKAFRFGLVHLNFSKRGVGASIALKGCAVRFRNSS